MYHVDMLCAYAKVQINTINKLGKYLKDNEKCYNNEPKRAKYFLGTPVLASLWFTALAQVSGEKKVTFHIII